MPHLPKSLTDSLSQYGHVDVEAFTEAHREEHKITSIRVNPFKKTLLDFETGQPVLWAKDAFYLDTRPSFISDPLFHAGCYYVQEAGSMFLEFALKQTLDFSKPLAILDLCAAPGGKSTLVNSLLNAQSLLVANELIKSRAAVLAQNLSKWGTSNTIVTNSDPQKFPAISGFFDAILIDAPCSGSGLFRKQPEAINEWSPENVRNCSIRQKKILTDTLASLKENGILIYSTCSYSKEENEDIVDWAIKNFEMEYVPLAIDKSWGIVETEAGYRFYPHLTKSEGFFCAVLRKKSVEPGFRSKKKTGGDVTKTELTLLEPFLNSGEGQRIFKKNNQFHLLNSAALAFLTNFEKQLYFRKAGTLIGEIKGKDLVPDHDLALSLALREQVRRLDLPKEIALKLLRKENFSVDQAFEG